MVFNPTLESSIRPEQPVERPSGMAALANLANIFISAQANAPTPRQPTQSERDNLALQPLANRLADLAEATPFGQRASVQRVAQGEIISFVRENPGLSTEAWELGSSILGIEQTQTEVSPFDAETSQINEFLQTPEGQTMYLASAVVGDDGQVDNEATALAFRSNFRSRQAELAKIEQTNRELSRVQGNVELWKAQSEAAIVDFVPAWNNESEQFISNLARIVTQGDEALDTWEEQVAALREYARTTKASYRSRGLAAGIHPSTLEEHIDTAIAPITDMLEDMQAFVDNKELFLNAVKNASELNSIQIMQRVFGAAAGNPEFRNEVARLMADEALIEQGGWTRMAEYLETASELSIDTPLNLFNNIPSSVEDAMSSTDLSNSAVVADLRAQGEPYILEKIFDNAAPALRSTPIESTTSAEGQSNVLTHLGMVINGADALDHPLSIGELEKIFNQNSIRVIASVAGQSSQTALDVKTGITGFAAIQSRRNAAELSSLVNGLPEGFSISYSGGRAQLDIDVNAFLATEDGVNFREWALELRGKEPIAMSREELLTSMSTYNKSIWGPNILEIDDNVKSYNFLNASLRRIVPEVNDILAAEGEMPSQFAGPTQLGEGANAILSLIDRTEGAGNYDTLFGHSQRNQFAGTRISNMTIGELREFANPNGAYGQWVKDQVGRVATPMGRYQFVGRTLFSLVDKLGIPDTAVFTPELQDAIFDWHIRNILGQRGTIEGKRAALRSEWHGFKSVSNAELDAAIRSYETGTPMDLAGAITTAREGGVGGPVPLAERLETGAEGVGVPAAGVDTTATGAGTVTDGTATAETELKERFNLTEDQLRMAQAIVVMSKGQLTSEGKDILKALGIDPESEELERLISEFLETEKEE